jgi:DNA-binding MarR family transcriptional regulator
MPQVEQAEFSALFLVYNRIRRHLDIKLKPLGLTLTSLQVLMAINDLQTHPPQCTRATVAACLGITNSTASIVIGGLIDKGLVLEVRESYDFKRKPLRLSGAQRHMRTYYRGLAVWDAVLEEWSDLLPEPHRSRMFDALEAANRGFDLVGAKQREDRYLKSLTKRSTRARVRAQQSLNAD